MEHRQVANFKVRTASINILNDENLKLKSDLHTIGIEYAKKEKIIEHLEVDNRRMIKIIRTKNLLIKTLFFVLLLENLLILAHFR